MKKLLSCLFKKKIKSKKLPERLFPSTRLRHDFKEYIQFEDGVFYKTLPLNKLKF